MMASLGLARFVRILLKADELQRARLPIPLAATLSSCLW